MQYGIEICRDHAQGVLSRAGQEVHIQIIISSWIENLPASTSLSGGVLLHSSTTKTGKADNVDQIQLKDGTAKLVSSKPVGETQLRVIDLNDQQCGITVSISDKLTPGNISTNRRRLCVLAALVK